jgi:hypothetical protein
MRYIVPLILFCASVFASPPYKQFFSSFDSASEFTGVVIPGTYNSTHWITANVDSLLFGIHGHHARTLSQGAPTNADSLNRVHRAYPYILLDQEPTGCIHGPIFIRFYLRAWMNLQLRSPTNDWFSDFTLSPDSVRTGGTWDTVVTGIIAANAPNYLSFEHILTTVYQANDSNSPNLSKRFTQGIWHRIDIFLDPNPTTGYIKRWQDGQLVNWATVHDLNNRTCAMHFGLYSSPATGTEPSQRVTAENDYLFYTSVTNEAEAWHLYMSGENTNLAQ